MIISIYRIIKKDGMYIAQKRGWFGFWRGIDSDEPRKWLNWYFEDTQHKWCKVNTIEDAEVLISKSKVPKRTKHTVVKYL